MTEDWLKFKKYPHIGHPLVPSRDSKWIRYYVKDEQKIKTHKFDPLIHRRISLRRYRPLEDAEKNEWGKRVRSVLKKKTRHIFYPSHLDSIIYSYYAYLLNSAYERFLEGKPYKNAPVAYRKIPIQDGAGKNKSNIEFAFEAFRFIEECKNESLSVLVADITSFFDNLDHRILHKQWKKVLGVDDLPDDHYSVYKSLVGFSYVDEVELYNRFKNELIVERFKPNSSLEKEYKKKKVNKMWNLRNENVVAFCSKKDFFAKGLDLIRSKKPRSNNARLRQDKREIKGIPQGTPISAILANIYMLDFDDHMFSYAYNRGAFYQRYSDDLIIICKREDEDFFKEIIITEIQNIACLEIQPEKTNIYRYEKNNKGDFIGGIVKDNEVIQDKQLEYLGFEYDGRKVRVKTVTFSRFYRGMKRSFRRGVYFAKLKHIESDMLYEKRLYKRYTHVGAKRRRTWKSDPNDPKGYIPSTAYDWGNLISYLEKANNVMREINGDNTISRQARRFWHNFHKLKKDSYRKIVESKKE